jgi:hypothetical protein
VVVATPLTVLVKVLVDVANERALVVVGADGRVVVLITPFTLLVNTLPATETVLLPMTDEVAEIPLIVVVKVLPASDCEKLLMMFATLELTPLMMVERRLPVDVATLLLMIVEVPLTPLVLFVKTLPALERVLLDMTEVVAVTPLMVVVSVLPATDCANELMMLATDESTPFTSVVSVFPVDVATFEVTIELVPTEPPTFEVRVLPEAPSVLLTCRFEIEVVPRFVVPVAVKLPVVRVFAVSALTDVVAKLAVPVAVILPVRTEPKFAILAKRLVKIPVTDWRKVATSELAVVVAFNFRFESSLI